MLVNHSIFIMYDGIVKDPRENMIRFLMEDHEESPMGEIFPVLNMIGMDDIKKINGLIMSSTRFNIFEFLHLFKNPNSVEISELEVLEDLTKIYFNRPNLYDNLSLLPMGDAANKLISQSFIDSIFFYTPYEDERVVKDISLTFGNNPKINYIFGDINNILEENNFQSLVINDLEVIKILNEYNSLDDKDILIADYVYLYDTSTDIPTLKVDGVLVNDIENEKKCKIKLFRPRREDDYDDEWIIQEEK